MNRDSLSNVMKCRVVDLREVWTDLLNTKSESWNIGRKEMKMRMMKSIGKKTGKRGREP